MFGSSGTEGDRLIAAIRDQTESVPTNMVFVIDIVSCRFGGKFTPAIKAQLQRYHYLQMLTLNDCGITSLENFPHIPGLIRLDLVFNEIHGEELIHIQGSRHLQTFMLGGNKVDKIEHLDSLKGMKQLLQLDLLNNPVTKLPGYRAQVFGKLLGLTILDTLDKGGKDAYTNTSMMQAVSRVPDALFDKSPPPPPVPLIVHVHKEQKKKLTSALGRTGSLDSAHGSVPIPKIAPKKSGSRASVAPVVASRSKAGSRAKAKYSAIVGSRTKSSKAGLTFPVGRIKRHLKETIIGSRVSVGSSVYIAAVLEYLTAQLMEISGNQAKNEKKTRITPLMIRNSLKNDEEMNKMFRNVTIGMAGE